VGYKTSTQSISIVNYFDAAVGWATEGNLVFKLKQFQTISIRKLLPDLVQLAVTPEKKNKKLLEQKTVLYFALHYVACKCIVLLSVVRNSVFLTYAADL